MSFVRVIVQPPLSIRSIQPTSRPCRNRIILPPHTHHGPLGLGSTQADESRPRRIWERTRDDMVSMFCWETRPRCVWLRVTGHKFSTLRPRHHPRPPDPCPTVARLTMKRRGRYLTGTNAKSCWIPTEASSTIHQVRHSPPTAAPIQCAPDETECSCQTIVVQRRDRRSKGGDKDEAQRAHSISLQEATNAELLSGANSHIPRGIFY